VTGLLIATVVVVVVATVATLFWAAWAPADLIALDVFALDPASAVERTDSRRPPPGPAQRRIDPTISVTERATTPDAITAVQRTWKQETQFRTDDNDGPDFVLGLMLTRGASH